MWILRNKYQINITSCVPIRYMYSFLPSRSWLVLDSICSGVITTNVLRCICLWLDSDSVLCCHPPLWFGSGLQSAGELYSGCTTAHCHLQGTRFWPRRRVGRGSEGLFSVCLLGPLDRQGSKLPWWWMMLVESPSPKLDSRRG